MLPLNAANGQTDRNSGNDSLTKMAQDFNCHLKALLGELDGHIAHCQTLADAVAKSAGGHITDAIAIV
ncbi:hypothetical protein ABID19_006961 [Mesorhizobium robiniae]|uniref:Uncharacterized protein n=1 Tax=Mesorhizobium robiniae TaxID=559315 RepID=A0ABV2H033_9HYPH